MTPNETNEKQVTENIQAAAKRFGFDVRPRPGAQPSFFRVDETKETVVAFHIERHIYLVFPTGETPSADLLADKFADVLKFVVDTKNGESEMTAPQCTHPNCKWQQSTTETGWKYSHKGKGFAPGIIAHCPDCGAKLEPPRPKLKTQVTGREYELISLAKSALPHGCYKEEKDELAALLARCEVVE